MRLLWSGTPDYAEILRDELTAAEIEVRILDEDAARAAGGLHFPRQMSQLWIVNDADFPRAAKIVWRIAGQWRPAQGRPPWQCPRCGATIDGQFTECWNCLVEPDEDDPRRSHDSRCDECGYPLWGLPERRCPECGSEF